MITNKHITKIVTTLMVLSVVACLSAVAFSGQIAAAAGGTGITMEYESKLFDTSEVLEVNILMEAADWENMLDNAMAEEYVQCDVEIGGQTFYRVGIRPKGNTSLSSIAMDPTTDRYSLKLEFDQYVEGQTCFGLDKLILNNSYADTTYMKEALVYDMFQAVGADASLYNHAKVSVNGEYWGLYLALEAVEDSFLLRNYGTQNGELYKPDSMNMGGKDRGNRPEMGDMDFEAMPRPEGNTDREPLPAFDGQMLQEFSFPEAGEMPDMGNFENRGGGPDGFGGGMFGNGGANLNYSDDSLDSYSTIWEGEVTGSGDADHKRVVTALKNISQGNDLERYMDIENLVKYMAVHIFSENDDSLSGSMAHNYYLYESDGQLNILPWDYNLAFGGMGMGGRSGANSTINGAIDDAWSSTDFFDTLLADEGYHAAYYAAMEQVVDYIQSGGFEEFYTRTRGLIDQLVETDPNAFYTYEEYLTGVETLYEVVTLRGQSIQGQLDGTIPSTSEAQNNSDTLIDASRLDLSALGSMNMGGGFGGRPGEAGDAAEESGGKNTTSLADQNTNGAWQGRTNTGGAPNMNFNGNSSTTDSMDTAILCGGCALVMLTAFLFALLYRRKPRRR